MGPLVLLIGLGPMVLFLLYMRTTPEWEQTSARAKQRKAEQEKSLENVKTAAVVGGALVGYAVLMFGMAVVWLLLFAAAPVPVAVITVLGGLTAGRGTGRRKQRYYGKYEV